MASQIDKNFEIVANKAGKSVVWRNFGFVKEEDIVDRKRVACRHCRIILKYSGNTTNLADHIKRRHPSLPTEGQTTSLPDKSGPGSRQTTLHKAFSPKLLSTSQRAQSISGALQQFIVKDLRPFSVVQNDRFRNLMSVLEPRFTVPDRHYFSDTALPALYDQVKEDVKRELSRTESISLTTDGWTSRVTESYITITSSHIDEDWKIKAYVLQTRSMPESHTGQHIADTLNEAVAEWGLPTADAQCPPLVTDNAANMTVAAQLAGSNIHIGCYAHTLNLACGKALKLGSVSKLLARIRRIIGFFHRSTTAAALLKEKQKMLILTSHKLIIDVQTRWNSAVNMVERFLEQQPAIFACLTSKELRGKIGDLSTLTEVVLKNWLQF